MKPKRISSPTNTAVKEAARLRRKRHRYESRLFLTEGEDLLDAALERGIIPRQVFVLEGEEGDILSRLGAEAGVEAFICDRAVMEKLSELGGGSRIIAIFGMLDRRFPNDMKAEDIADAPLLYLAGAGDPGNVGTLMRSGAALGAGAVILGPDSADPYSPKSLRATMGAVFQIPFFLDISADALADWQDGAEVKIICADAHEGVPVWKADLRTNFVLVLGPEREGIPRRLLDMTAEKVHIPQAAGTESINVAMAGTAIMYEALRQRSAPSIHMQAATPAGNKASATQPAESAAQAGAQECSCEKTERPDGQKTPGRT